MYQAVKNSNVAFENETLEGLKQDIVNYYDDITDTNFLNFYVQIADDDCELLIAADLNDKFNAEVRAELDERLLESHYRLEA